MSEDNRKIVEQRVVYFVKHKPIRWKDVKHIKFQDDDIVNIGYVEPWENGPDNSGGDHYEVRIIRQRPESDYELQIRLEKEKNTKDYNKRMRFEQYLRLKAEFENAEKE
jgi:hypothetical protein